MLTRARLWESKVAEQRSDGRGSVLNLRADEHVDRVAYADKR